QESTQMPLFTVEFGGKITHVCHFYFFRIDPRRRQALYHRLFHHGDKVAAFFHPIARKISLISTQNVDRCSHAFLLETEYLCPIGSSPEGQQTVRESRSLTV